MLHVYKKFQVNRTKIKGGCQSDTKSAPQESWSDLTLVEVYREVFSCYSYLDNRLKCSDKIPLLQVERFRDIHMNFPLKASLPLTNHSDSHILNFGADSDLSLHYCGLMSSVLQVGCLLNKY